MANTSAALNQSGGGGQPGAVPYERLPDLLALIDNIKQSAEEMNRAVHLIGLISDRLDFSTSGPGMVGSGGGGGGTFNSSQFSGMSRMNQNQTNNSGPAQGMMGIRNQSSLFSTMNGSNPNQSYQSGGSNPGGQNRFNSNFSGMAAGSRGGSPPPCRPVSPVSAPQPLTIPPYHAQGYFMGNPVLLRQPEVLQPLEMYEYGPRNLIMHSPPPMSPPSQIQQYSPPPMASSPVQGREYAPFPRFNLSTFSEYGGQEGQYDEHLYLTEDDPSCSF